MVQVTQLSMWQWMAVVATMWTLAGVAVTGWLLAAHRAPRR